MQDQKTLIIYVEDHGWLQPDGSFGKEEDGAAKFVFRTSPTGIDERRIERIIQKVCAEVDGDPDELGAWRDRCVAMEQARAAAWGCLSDIVAVDAVVSRNDNESEEDLRRRQDDFVASRWRDCTDPTFIKMRDRWGYFRDQLNEFEMWARWEVLQVSVPPGWERVHARLGYDRIRGGIIAAWSQLTEQSSQGKS